MNTNNSNRSSIASANRYLKSDIGQRDIAEKIKLENNSPFKIFQKSFDSDTIIKHNSINGNYTFDKARIAGNHSDLGNRYNNVISKIGESKNPSSYDYISDLKKIRDENISRSAMSGSAWDRYKKSSLGMDADSIRASTPSYGGGANTFYAVSGKEFHKSMGAIPHLNRAANFAMGKGFGQDMLNNLGIITKHQKDVVSSSSVGRFNKFMTYTAPLLGAIHTASNTSEYLSGERESTISDNAATKALSTAIELSSGIYGFRVAKESAHAITSLVPKSSKVGGIGSNARWLLGKQGIGVTAGLIGGATASIGLGAGFEIMRSMASKDNSINNVARKIYSGDSFGSTSINTNQLLTSRARALDKLSKSSLNDRSFLLGNEAMVMKGMY